ncbi:MULTISPECIES: winged helix-turn-helix transcriptional regulator [Bradyrhizobium]|uniref:winged helix-turn-helix transcriptional regulator n=1 Tax=Bradyrhizobium TaxID=374 RepID=UPI0003F6021D|nr:MULTISPECIES: helix-turn-helix domain-containing protein [Bradyrhizobium]WLB91615.1 helix-turn-helix domain-containing protein [Bradyrhizobium japonicum USDA 135]GLR97639.1 transcriptional regulator [Bradyrhizobium liaoningense]
MDFETGMENLTTNCDDDCDCSRDPALLGDFKRAIDALGGKWKLEILFTLMNGAVRFGALRRSIGGITQHMLTTQLRELEEDGLVSRIVLAEKPLRVAYELTDAAYGLLPAFKEILSWSRLYGDARLLAARQT